MRRTAPQRDRLPISSHIQGSILSTPIFVLAYYSIYETIILRLSLYESFSAIPSVHPPKNDIYNLLASEIIVPNLIVS